jgi:hypothetical protein
MKGSSETSGNARRTPARDDTLAGSASEFARGAKYGFTGVSGNGFDGRASFFDFGTERGLGGAIAIRPLDALAVALFGRYVIGHVNSYFFAAAFSAVCLPGASGLVGEYPSRWMGNFGVP